MAQVTLTDALMKSMVGGTLVEYKIGCGMDVEYERGTIVEASFDPALYEGNGGVVIKTHANCFYRGSMEIVHKLKKSPEGIYSFHVIVMEAYYAFAPKGVNIPSKS